MLGDTVNVRAVRILLECNLVCHKSLILSILLTELLDSESITRWLDGTQAASGRCFRVPTTSQYRKFK